MNLEIFQPKNLVFPFKKLTIEYLNEIKTISDFINFNIYTNISMGTPKKNVAHFITKNDQLFYYNILYLHSRSYKEYDKIHSEIENLINIYYNTENSSSFETINDYYQIYSDVYYFYDLNQTERYCKLNFNMNPSNKQLKLYGDLDLYYFRENTYEHYNKYFFKMLKEIGFIDDSYFTFVYTEYDLNDNFIYLNDNYNDILGKLIVGERPHEFAPNKYKEEDEVKLNGQFILDINEIKFQSQALNYSENDIRLSLTFDSEFIKGSLQYKNQTDILFFNDLISKNLCRIDYIDENIYKAQDIVYSCENNNIIKEKIKTFPTLYFLIKPYNLTFLFNFTELFKLHNNRLYFLIYYKIDSYSNWEVGELFLRKYITSFNYYSKTISFYKSQVDEINKKTDKIIPDGESKKNQKDANPDNKNQIFIILIIVTSIILIFAVVAVVILTLKLKKFRKKRAAELTDDNYDYTSADNIN